MTPRQSQGFNDHYDVHDVFVMQVAGEKQWRIRPPVHVWPTRDQPWTNYREQVEAATAEAPLLDVILRPGDCLYLPRGFLHSATATEEVSAHVTLGVHVWTRVHLAEALVAEALATIIESEDARAPLDLGVEVRRADDLASDLERLRAALARSMESLAVERVAARLARKAQASARPGPIAPVAQALRALALADDDVIQLRPFVQARLVDGSNSTAVLQSRAGTLTVPPEDQPAVEALLARGETPVSDLGIDLARRLLAAGIAT